jgi:hypothetical protein
LITTSFYEGSNKAIPCKKELNMSRTYRKNACRWRKFRGEIYRTTQQKGIVGKEKYYSVYDFWDRTNEIDAFEGGKYYVEFLIPDRDNWGNGVPKGVKKMCHRIDRARCKNAMIRDIDDVHYSTCFDPWDWD